MVAKISTLVRHTETEKADEDEEKRFSIFASVYMPYIHTITCQKTVSNENEK
jgi:hypothetical protein